MKPPRPFTRPGLVLRADLIDRLEKSTAPVVAVVAPAGFGKTSLLCQWADISRRSLAWLTLDSTDDDPVILCSNLAEALRGLVSDVSLVLGRCSVPMARTRMTDPCVPGIGHFIYHDTVRPDHRRTRQRCGTRRASNYLPHFAYMFPIRGRSHWRAARRLRSRLVVSAPRAGSSKSAGTTWR